MSFLKLKIVVVKLALILLMNIGYGNSCLAQNTNAVRYQITANALLKLIEKYPEKKEEFQKKLDTETPSFADIYIDSTRVIEVIRYANKSIGRILLNEI